MSSTPHERHACVAVLRTPPVRTAPRQASDLAEAAVAAWMPRLSAGVIALVAEELVANAVRWAGGAVTVRMLTTADQLRIEVIDGDPRPPLTAVDQAAAHGLDMVTALSDRWGYEPRGAGKAVWAEFGVCPPP